MANIKPLNSNSELTVDECLFGMYQVFQKGMTQYFAPKLSIDSAVAICVKKRKKFLIKYNANHSIT